MSTTPMYNAINQSNWSYFAPMKDKYEEKIDGLLKGVDERFPGVLRDNLLDYGFLFPKNAGLNIEIVLDTNTLFKQVLGHLKGYTSPLPRMVRSGFLVLYAPPELRQEIHEKIDKKIKTADRNSAKVYAEEILAHVKFVNRVSQKVRNKAKELLIERDPKDIAFLAVTFQKDVHGVLTYDLDFEVAENVQVWKMGRLGQVVTSYRRGSFCLWFFARGLPLAFRMLAAFFALLFKAMIGLGRLVAKGISWIGNQIVGVVQKIPPELVLLGAVLSLVAISLNQELQKKLEQGITFVKQWLIDLATRIHDGLLEIIQLFRDVLLLIFHFAPLVVELLGYMVYDAIKLTEIVRDIETSRPSQTPLPARSFEELLSEVKAFLHTL
jgi:predicted nucleic acid-binding protein